MAYTLSQLRGMSRDELVSEHDALAQNTSVGIGYYLDELARRDAIDVAERAEAETAEVQRLTRVITLLTAINVAATIGALIAALAR